MDKNNLIKVALVGVLLSAVGGLAIWNISLTGNSIVNVASSVDGAVIFTSALDTNDIDVTNSSATVVDTVTIKNNDGNIDFTMTNITTVTDVEDTCLDYENDIAISLSELPSFSMVPNEEKVINLTYDIARQSCPQTVEVELTLVGTPV